MQNECGQLVLAGSDQYADLPAATIAINTYSAVTLEAWVKLDGSRNGSPMYVIGKGRTGSPRFDRDNQNWSLRVVGSKGMTKLSFLFATARGEGESHWHRWTSKAGFDAKAGWHHA